MKPAPARMVAAALVATTAGVLPVFLVGGLAVQIRSDLGFGEAGLGGVVTVFFAASALTSTPAGRIVDRLGTYRSIVIAAVISIAAFLGVGMAANGWALLAAFVVLGGVANGVTQPASNLLLARGIRVARQGLAFGVKQAAVPVASFLAGVAVPVLGLTVGWRWAFVSAVAGPLCAAALTPRGSHDAAPHGRPPRTGDAPSTALLLCAVTAGLGTASATALAAFLVETAVLRGVAEGAAGLILAAGSVASITARIVAGWRADMRTTGHLTVVAGMLALGAAGFVVLSVGDTVPAFVFGSVLGLGVGWGWNGVLVYAVVRSSPNAPGAATGVTQTGLYLGGVLGPLSFGIAAQHLSFTIAWLAGAGLLLAGAVAALAAGRLLHRIRPMAGSAHADTGLGADRDPA